jgi:GNAT superfamily N-acetyltransferase
MSERVIRRAVSSDRDAVLTLLLAQLREHHNPTPDAVVARALDGLLAHPERGAVLVATLDGRIVGMAALSTMWTLEHGGPSVWLDELYVEPSRRGQGIGRALLAAAYDAAREHGGRSIDLEVDADHDRATHLYAREGFLRLPRTRWVRHLA